MKIQNPVKLLLVLLIFTACSKKDNVTPSKLPGTYKGTIMISNSNKPLDSVRLVISAKTYEAINSSAISRGAYKVNNNQVTFSDTLARITLAGLIVMHGTFESAVKGDSLFLTQKSGDKQFTFTYKLKRQ